LDTLRAPDDIVADAAARSVSKLLEVAVAVRDPRIQLGERALLCLLGQLHARGVQP